MSHFRSHSQAGNSDKWFAGGGVGDDGEGFLPSLQDLLGLTENDSRGGFGGAWQGTLKPSYHGASAASKALFTLAAVRM